jgi:hypothetical protein
VSSLMLDPSVIDASTLQPKLASPIYLPIGIEGRKDTGGTAAVGILTAISRVDESSVAFGPNSSIHQIIKAVLDRGAGPVIAVASASNAAPTLAQRQTAWQAMESDPKIRLRLTDSEVSADHAALAVSVANANLIYNKQIALVGLPTATNKAAWIAGAAAIAAGGTDPATRTAIVAPGVYDGAGTLRGGSFAAAAVGAEIAKNADPTNDLDLWDVPFLTGIERGADGLAVFRRKVAAGVAVDDFEDLLQGGVSPLQPSRNAGAVATTHLRTVYITDGTYDSLYTRIIVDQIFLDVKNYILDNNFLRAGNTETVRARIQSGVQAVLAERAAWIAPVVQSNGSLGYNVSVTSSTDQRQVTIGYEGTVRRGISTIKVAANLTIPV